MTIREATFSPTRTVQLAKAAGCTCAEAIGIYPPGIALVMPGEVIDQRAIDYLISREERRRALRSV
ncbi:MAG: hypothetical protein R2912_04955 [Eubacteriales bacterium]